ncbi:motility associated factor glycosyltransferase family protein [Shewanella pealeana]|uniref:6-hydroxymethylpterin diphosphokinase MptE-like domain-containing protein n=1 Tax=Shewanella pealeana (strain ATCC 700345 / ANG-SQ1) TaxID=398579 RepID=A8GYI5_SHEPA|nr:6-hydroxymethylpterin diphosphokinase MptE-like protein [Shewanella pealeana]ABV85372.1 protein of unknown function DUF115 [Shewanella pealeana ATCC 700345]
MNTLDLRLEHQFFVNDFGEYYLPSVNRNTFKKIDSNTIFKQTFKDEIFQEDRLHIVIGTDSGLLLNYILMNGIPSGSKYIFIEPAAVLDILNINIDAKFQQQVKLIEIEEFAKQLANDEYDLYLIKNQYITHNSMASCDGIVEEYNTIIYNVQKQLTNLHYARNRLVRHKDFLIQQLRNIADNQYPASLLRNRFEGKSCIVIGGGPSLDEHMEWITKNYNQLFIITVSRVAAKLSKANIPAHIIVSIDPHDISFEANIDTMALAQESLLINSYHINHRILSQWQGSSLYVGPRIPWSKADSDNVSSVGPTVTNSAVRIAIELGFSTILLAGADFCHSSTGASHAKGSVEADAGLNHSRIDEWVETYAGNKAETPVELLGAAQTLQIEAANHPTVNIINLSIDAAKLEGVNYQAAETVNLMTTDMTPKQVLDLIETLIEDKSLYLDNMLTDLQLSTESLSDINKLSLQAIDLNLEIKSVSVSSKKYRNIANKISRIEEQIDNQHGKFSYLVKEYGYVEFAKFLTTKESKHWTADEMQKMTHLYYEAFKCLTEELLGYITDATNIIKTRQLELIKNVNLAELTRQWEQHNQPGRVHIFQKVRTELGLSYDDTHECLTAAKANYHTQLTAKTHSYFSMKKTNSSLHNTLAKITDLYKSKNSAGLQQLFHSIEPMIESDSLAQRLFYLAKSYVFILKEDNMAALSELQKIDEINQTEVILKQMIALASELQIIDVTVQSLAKITAFSNEYLPLYAHALTIQGDNIQAINTYLDYLDVMPNDTKVRLSLGIFLLKIGQVDGAITCFKQVLTVDINNLSALSYLKQLVPTQ